MESSENAKKKAPRQKELKSTQFQKYEVIEIRRDEIHNAPYNPRSISAKSRRRLRDNLQKVGLLAPIVWNRRTGNIVSGHQRLSCIDSLEHTHEYKLLVSAVDLDEKTEKEQNIFFNNTEAQGVFDERLIDMLNDNDLNIENMGFSEAEVFAMTGESMAEEQLEEMARLSNEMHKAIEAFSAAETSSNAKNDTEFYLVVVFKDNKSRDDFLIRHGFEVGRYLDGRDLDEVLSSSRLPDESTAPR